MNRFLLGQFTNYLIYIQSYDDEDWESVQRALSSPFIKHMDVDYARLANAVPLPEGIKNVPKASAKSAVVSNAHQAYTSPPPEEVSHSILRIRCGCVNQFTKGENCRFFVFFFFRS